MPLSTRTSLGTAGSSARATVLIETALVDHDNRFRNVYTPPKKWGFAEGPLLASETGSALGDDLDGRNDGSDAVHIFARALGPRAHTAQDMHNKNNKNNMKRKMTEKQNRAKSGLRTPATSLNSAPTQRSGGKTALFAAIAAHGMLSWRDTTFARCTLS